MNKHVNKIKFFLILILLVVGLTGCDGFIGRGTVRGSGNMIDGTFEHGDITRVELHGLGATLNISSENSAEMRYTVDDNLREYINITYNNGVLRISTRNNRSINSGRELVFNISSDVLNYIVVDGAVNLQGQGVFTSPLFLLEVNGAADVNLQLETEELFAIINGAASVILSGRTESLVIEAAGAVDVNARNLLSQYASVSVDGVGSIYVYAAVTLRARVAGVGSIIYWGDAVVDASADGLASITRGN